MLSYRNCWILLTLLIGQVTGVTESSAQVLKGRVSDGTTNEPLPAATVQISGTFQGTITNTDGLYAIAVDDLPVDLVVRYIGYRTDTLTVDTLIPTEFQLEPVEFEMDQMVITDEDPAIWIMSQVIEKKQQWQKTLKTFEAQAFSRYILSNDTGIVAITESAATAWWDHERGLRERITATRKTGNLPFESALPAALTVMNLYSDNINILGHTLIGVTHPNALDHYNFTLKNTRGIDDINVYDIAVETKNAHTSGFLGTVSVLDGEFALLEVELSPGPAFQFPYPFQVLQTSVQQQFSSYGGQVWLPIDLRFHTIIEISLGAILSLPPGDVNMVSRFTDYQLNVTLPDSLFEDKRLITTDSLAIASGDTFEREGIVVPLTPEESIAYASIDSTHSLDEAYAARGYLGSMVQFQDRSSSRRGLLSFGSSLKIQPNLWYNRVDAFHGGIKMEPEITDALKIQIQAGLNTGQRGAARVMYKGSARIDRDWFLNVGYHAENVSTYVSELRPRWINSLLILFGQMDYFNYYRREGVSVTAGYEFDWRSATISTTFLHESHSALAGNVSYDLFANSEVQRLNPPVPEGDLQSIKFDFSIGQRSLLQIGPQRYLTSNIEITTSGSDFSFRRYYLSAGGRINTFLKRRWIPATLDYGISIGLTSDNGGELPPQRSFIVEGGTGIYHWGGALYSLRGLPYQGNSIIFGYWEHNFRTLPFELLSIESFVTRGLSVIVFGGHALIRGTDPRNNDWIRHNELGVSMSGILGLIRLNLAYRIGENIVYPSMSIARIF